MLLGLLDMIRFVKGNLLESSAQALVNIVNAVGVMGKGIASHFKEAYPNNYVLYKKACKDKLIRVGSMFITQEQNVYGIYIIIVSFLQKRPGESLLSIPIYKEYVRLVLNHFIKFEKQNSELLYVTPH